MAVHRRVLPSSLINPGIGRAFAVGSDTEQRAEGVEGVEAPVKPERELIQVGLQVLRLDAPMMRALQPSLEVRKHEVDNREVFFRHLGISSFDNWQVLVAAKGQPIVGRSGVGDDDSAGLNRFFHKSDQRLSRTRGDDFQPQTASVAPAAPHGLVAFLGGALANLNSSDHQRLFVGMRPLAFTPDRTADVGFINLNMVLDANRAADAVTIRADHASPQLVENLKGRLVALEAKLPLELIGLPESEQRERAARMIQNPLRQQNGFTLTEAIRSLVGGTWNAAAPASPFG